MISFRRTHAPASLLVLACLVCALLLALPAAAPAAPVEEPRPPQLAFEPGSHDFGQVEANHSNGQVTFQLRNNGEAAVQVYSIEIGGSGASAFWTNGGDCPGRNLNPNETCSLQVSFNPYDAIPFVAQLRANAEGGTVVSAELEGEGGRPEFTTAVNPVNFGSVPVGSAGVTKTIDLTNTGNMAGGVFIAVIAGGAVGSFQLLDENCTGIPIFPGSTCNLVVRFQPISSGAKTARLGLFGDSEGGAQIFLTGVGFDPEPAAQQASSAATSAAPGPPRVGGVHRKPHRFRGLARRRIALSDLHAAR